MPALKSYRDRHLGRKSVQATTPTWIPGQQTAAVRAA
jgi:hypothetical protein